VAESIGRSVSHYFQKRRILSLLITVAVIVFLGLFLKRQDDLLHRATFSSGYLLILGIFFLAAFNVRKKLSFLPLGSATTWLQLHIYVSLVVIAVFVMHVEARLPSGPFETVLFTLFVLVASSGVYGLIITRRIPRQITKLREEVVYERIPALRTEVANRAHAVVRELLAGADAEALTDYYSESLIPYFAGNRGLLYYVRPSSRKRNQLQSDLSSLIRYESAAERAAQQKLRQLIDKRDDLDYHEAQQRKLKTWLFGHVAMTYALLIASVFHAVLVHAFWGLGR
jgi:hypothetical protein